MDLILCATESSVVVVEYSSGKFSGSTQDGEISVFQCGSTDVQFVASVIEINISAMLRIVSM